MTSSILICTVLSALLVISVVQGKKCGGNHPPPPQSIHCPACVHSLCSPNLILPFPGDCSRFCMCDHGYAVAFDCPAGLHFNPSTMICDWPLPDCQAHVDGCKVVKVNTTVS